MYKRISILITCVVLIFTFFCRASSDTKNNNLQKDPYLKIYLPREVTIKDSNLTLGKVSIIRGDDSLSSKAEKISLGRISVPGQKIIINRPMLLSRLACNGITTSQVTITGAEKIAVKQQNQTISSSEFVSLANSFLEKNPPGDSVSSWKLTRKPRDFIVSAGGKDIRFSCRLVQTGVKNLARVEVTVLSGTSKLGVRQVTFAMSYEHQQAVTKVDIPAGEVISPENIKIEKIQSNDPEPAGFKPPYGLLARRRLPANTVLAPNMLESPEPPVILKRNQNVLIRIERPGFLITAMGIAMQNGRAGDYIKVRNTDSMRIILARIKKDGTVEPGI